MAFSQVLRKLREERNLTQKDIASFLGLTRQAIASYEHAKREPDYETLKKLADFFGVSVDFLLGRSYFRNSDTDMLGRNIELIRDNISYQEFSENITKKTGAVITPEMLELYEKGERIPFMGIVKILAKYALVHESFFYKHNTYETYENERNIYIGELLRQKNSEKPELITTVLGFMEGELVKWLVNKSNIEYIKLAKEIQEAGIRAESLRPLLENIKTQKTLPGT